jgi:hypothetical protein
MQIWCFKKENEAVNALYPASISNPQYLARGLKYAVFVTITATRNPGGTVSWCITKSISALSSYWLDHQIYIYASFCMITWKCNPLCIALGNGHNNIKIHHTMVSGLNFIHIANHIHYVGYSYWYCVQHFLSCVRVYC